MILRRNAGGMKNCCFSSLQILFFTGSGKMGIWPSMILRQQIFLTKGLWKSSQWMRYAEISRFMTGAFLRSGISSETHGEGGNLNSLSGHHFKAASPRGNVSWSPCSGWNCMTVGRFLEEDRRCRRICSTKDRFFGACFLCCGLEIIVIRVVFELRVEERFNKWRYFAADDFRWCNWFCCNWLSLFWFYP